MIQILSLIIPLMLVILLGLAGFKMADSYRRS
jgi:hypothetical protein